MPEPGAVRPHRSPYGWRGLAGDAAGGTVAALIALPYGLAMAQLMGLPPALGLFTSILTAPITTVPGRNPVLIDGTASATVPFIADEACRRNGLPGHGSGCLGDQRRRGRGNRLVASCRRKPSGKIRRNAGARGPASNPSHRASRGGFLTISLPASPESVDSLGGWRIFKRSIRPDRPCRRYHRTRAGHARDGRGGGASFESRSAGQSNRITRWSILAMQSATSRNQEQGRDNRRQAECPFHQPTPP